MLLLAATAGVPGAAPAQEEPPDSVARDTAQEAGDGAGDPPPVFPRLRSDPGSGTAGTVQSWDREQLLRSDAVTLQDFLEDRVPGVLPLRSNFYFGPHQLAEGPLGPGFLRVEVDGRELHPLETGQVDLSRIALARVDRLTVIRRAGGTLVRVWTPRFGGGEAYSRITGGTGNPSADLIRGVFMNGAGGDFAVAGTVDHLNIADPDMSGDRLDVSGRIGWIPGESAGVEVVYHSDAVGRTAVEEEEFDRRDLLLHARGTPLEGLQLDLWAGRTTRSPGPRAEPADTAAAGGGKSLDVEHAELGLGFRRGPVRLEADARAADGEGLPELDGRARATVEIAEALAVHASADLGVWSDFETASVTAGLVVRPGGRDGPVVLRAEGATGDRGVPRPGAIADSLSFDALAGALEVGLGPYRLTGRGTYRKVSRQLPFGGEFDSALAPGPEAEVTGLEGRLQGPLLPVDALERRIRVHGFWRRNEVSGAEDALYVPSDVARGEVRVRDEFFQGNLVVSGTFRVRYRSAMLSAAPGQSQPVTLPEERSLGSSLALEIDTFRIWWRVDNLQREVQRDFADLRFPDNRNVFGVTWEFFN